jgi:paraquat-inducible protein B
VKVLSGSQVPKLNRNATTGSVEGFLQEVKKVSYQVFIKAQYIFSDRIHVTFDNFWLVPGTNVES